MLLGKVRGKTEMTAEVPVPEGALDPNCQQSRTKCKMCTKQVEKAAVSAETRICCPRNASNLGTAKVLILFL